MAWERTMNYPDTFTQEMVAALGAEFSPEEIEFLPRAASGGMALGLAGNEKFADAIAEITLPLEPGDRIILYTDGFSEAMNTEREDYGDARLLGAALGRGRDASARDLLEAINADMVGFTDAALQHDDMTMIVLRFD